MNLGGQVALVTGGAKRVGRAIAVELARAGCDVCLHYHTSQAEAQGAARELLAWGRRVLLVCGDLAESSSWQRIILETIVEFQRLDILVNNASLFLTDKEDRIESFDVGVWEKMLRVNLLAPTGLIHYAQPHLQASPNGCIVNLGDVSATRPWKDHLAYGVSKAGLVAVTRSLAKALAPKVRVNAVAPGIAVFPEAYTGEMRERLTRKVPLQREGSPEEVARLVRYLAESGQYVTGQVIAIDGGRSVT